MAYEQIPIETQRRVGIVGLNRPEWLNAWTAKMSAELTDQIRAWNADDGIGAFIIAGEGRGFCAGADIGGFSERLDEKLDWLEETRSATRSLTCCATQIPR